MIATLDSVLSGGTRPGMFAWIGDPSVDIGGRARLAGWTVRALHTVQVRDPAGLYEQIAADWHLPEWFGRNLDALWDVLGELAVAPLLLVWDGHAEMADADPELAQTLLELLRDACTQAPSMAVVLTEAPKLIDLDALL